SACFLYVTLHDHRGGAAGVQAPGLSSGPGLPGADRGAAAAGEVSAGPGSLALVLAGGGARAAYEVGVLSAIGGRMPGLEFPTLTGVSAGAINAVYLAAHAGTLSAACGALRDHWSHLVVDRVYRIQPWHLGRALLRGVAGPLLGARGEAAVVRGLMDMSPLRESLAARLDFGGIDANI